MKALEKAKKFVKEHKNEIESVVIGGIIGAAGTIVGWKVCEKVFENGTGINIGKHFGVAGVDGCDTLRKFYGEHADRLVDACKEMNMEPDEVGNFVMLVQKIKK